MQVCLLLQVLKHSASNGNPGAHASTASSIALDTQSQLFPFKEEYTRGSINRSKVPSLRKAVQSEAAPYDQKVDIWAVGCLLFELLTGASRHSCLLDAAILTACSNAYLWQEHCDGAIAEVHDGTLM